MTETGANCLVTDNHKGRSKIETGERRIDLVASRTVLDGGAIRLTRINDQARRKMLAGAFAMPAVQTMVSRKSSITNAFVNSVVPAIPPTHEEIEEALAVLGIEPTDVRCAYCENKATEWGPSPTTCSKTASHWVHFRNRESGPILRQVQSEQGQQALARLDLERCEAVAHGTRTCERRRTSCAALRLRTVAFTNQSRPRIDSWQG